VRNNAWRLMDCRLPPCDYSVFNTSYEVRCHSPDGGATPQVLQCLDRQATAALGNCPIADFVQLDVITNTSFTIQNDFIDYCRVWGPCACNPVVFRNLTDLTISTFYAGDIIFKHPPTAEINGGQPPCDSTVWGKPCRSGPSVFTRYPCVPINGETPQLVTPDMQFVPPTLPILGDPAITKGEALTGNNGTYYVFFEGQINASCNYACPPPPPLGQRDPETLPCEYALSPENGTWCLEGTPQCCADYLFDACIYNLLYKTNCSLSAGLNQPAVVNGSVVLVSGSQLRVDEPFYDCTYLSSCSFAPGVYNGTIEQPGSSVYGCNATQCVLDPCRLNNTLLWDVNSSCFQELNLNLNHTAYYNVTILSGLPLDVLGLAVTNGVLPPVLLLDAKLSDSRVLSIFAGDVTLYGSGTISCATLLSGPSCANITYYAGLLYYPATVIGDVLVNGTLLNDTLFGGSFVNFPILAPYPACQNLSYATNNTVCLWMRNCSQYYVGNYPAPGYSYHGQNVSGTTQLSAFCSVQVDTCAFPTPNGSPLCQCQSQSFAGPALLDTMLQGVVSFEPVCTKCQNISVFCADGTTPIATECVGFNCTSQGCQTSSCPLNSTCADVGCNIAGPCSYSICTTNHNLNSSDPVPTYELTRILDLNTLNCATHTFVPCQCPPPAAIIFCTFDPGNGTVCADLTVNECLATPNCTVPSSYLVQGSSANSTCQNGQLTCDCNVTLISKTFPPVAGSRGFHIANLAGTLTNLQIIQNSVCYWDTAWENQQMNHSLVAQYSITEVEPYTQFGTSRILYNENLQVTGISADYADNDIGTPYRRDCNKGCPQQFIMPLLEQQYGCYVDANADKSLTSYGDTLFSTLYECMAAVKDQGKCTSNRTILVK
jgi:hypothetical protein